MEPKILRNGNRCIVMHSCGKDLPIDYDGIEELLVISCAGCNIHKNIKKIVMLECNDVSIKGKVEELVMCDSTMCYVKISNCNIVKLHSCLLFKFKCNGTSSCKIDMFESGVDSAVCNCHDLDIQHCNIDIAEVWDAETVCVENSSNIGGRFAEGLTLYNVKSLSMNSSNCSTICTSDTNIDIKLVDSICFDGIYGDDVCNSIILENSVVRHMNINVDNKFISNNSKIYG